MINNTYEHYLCIVIWEPMIHNTYQEIYFSVSQIMTLFMYINLYVIVTLMFVKQSHTFSQYSTNANGTLLTDRERTNTIP